MPDTGAPYFIPFADPTDLVRDWPDLSEDVALAIVAALENIPVTQKKIEAFTGSGTWTVPAGVTYAIAHVLGGGGGISAGGDTDDAGDGSSSSVAFATTTPTSLGGIRTQARLAVVRRAGQANSGQGARAYNTTSFVGIAAGDAQWVVGGAPVTPEASITVTVGAGGTAGTSGAAGGSGYVYIEYFEEV